MSYSFGFVLDAHLNLQSQGGERNELFWFIWNLVCFFFSSSFLLHLKLTAIAPCLVKSFLAWAQTAIQPEPLQWVCSTTGRCNSFPSFLFYRSSTFPSLYTLCQALTAEVRHTCFKPGLWDFSQFPARTFFFFFFSSERNSSGFF